MNVLDMTVSSDDAGDVMVTCRCGRDVLDGLNVTTLKDLILASTAHDCNGGTE